MRRRGGDRRAKARFEIVGDLWGRIDMSAPMLVQDICRDGALLDSPSLLPTGSIHWVTVLAGGERHRIQIRVRHSRLATEVAARPPRYAIGVEFLNLPDAAQAALAGLGVG